MKPPKFTDSFRYPVPYKSSGETNIKETLDRAERQLKAEKERERANRDEARTKTISLRRTK